MKKSTCALIFCTLLFTSAWVAAQDPSTPFGAPEGGDRLAVEKGEMEGAAMKDVVVEKKIGGRLPNGYRSHVTNAQRDDIYKLQIEYGQIIERLRLRIRMLEIERDRRIDALLTDEQAQKIKTTLGSLESEKHEIRRERPVSRRNRPGARQAAPAAAEAAAETAETTE